MTLADRNELRAVVETTRMHARVVDRYLESRACKDVLRDVAAGLYMTATKLERLTVVEEE